MVAVNRWLNVHHVHRLPTLREIGELGVPHAEGEAEAENEPALRKHPNKRRS